MKPDGKTVCGCRLHIIKDGGMKLHEPVANCPFCCGSGILRYTCLEDKWQDMEKRIAALETLHDK